MRNEPRCKCWRPLLASLLHGGARALPCDTQKCGRCDQRASFLLPPSLAGSPCPRGPGRAGPTPRPSAVISKALLKIPGEPALGVNLDPKLFLPPGGPQRATSSSGPQGPGSAVACPPLPSLRSGSSLVVLGKSFLPQGCACVLPSGSLSGLA